LNAALCIGAADKISDQGRKAAPQAPKVCHGDRLSRSSSASSWKSCPCLNLPYNNRCKDKKATKLLPLEIKHTFLALSTLDTPC